MKSWKFTIVERSVFCVDLDTEDAYIVTVARHVVAVVDGKYYDTWDSGNCSMYGWYEKV